MTLYIIYKNIYFIILVCVNMISFDLFFLQLLLILSIMYINYIKDSFYLIINSILILSFVGLILWFYNFDIYVNFLIIIDLGLFFTLLGFSLNILNMMGVFNYLNNKYIVFTYFFIFIISMFYIFYFSNIPLLNLSDTIFRNSTLSLYNYYNLFSIYYSSDLQLMYSIYFNFNFIEFVVMNLVLYIGIFVVYALLNFKFLVNNSFYRSGNFFLNKINFNFNYYNIFLKNQNFQNQVNQTITVRVWDKKLNKTKY